MKKYAGLTEYRWRNLIKGSLNETKITDVSKGAECYRWKERLILHGDWERFPEGLRIPVNIYALTYAEMYPELEERKRMGLQMRIDELLAEIESLKSLLAAMSA